jgi:hypothetical protein
LSSSESLSDQGYNFPGGHFKLNDNFGVGEKDLLFVFNTYEIAAGAAGPTEIVMPYQAIWSLLKPICNSNDADEASSYGESQPLTRGAAELKAPARAE